MQPRPYADITQPLLVRLQFWKHLETISTYSTTHATTPITIDSPQIFLQILMKSQTTELNDAQLHHIHHIFSVCTFIVIAKINKLNTHNNQTKPKAFQELYYKSTTVRRIHHRRRAQTLPETGQGDTCGHSQEVMSCRGRG